MESYELFYSDTTTCTAVLTTDMVEGQVTMPNVIYSWLECSLT